MLRHALQACGETVGALAQGIDVVEEGIEFGARDEVAALLRQELGGVARERAGGLARPRERTAERARDLEAGDVAENARERLVEIRREARRDAFDAAREIRITRDVDAARRNCSIAPARQCEIQKSKWRRRDTQRTLAAERGADRKSVAVSSLTGVQLDLHLDPADGPSCPKGDPGFVPLVGFDGPQGWEYIGVGPDEAARLLVLDVPGGQNVVVAVFATSSGMFDGHITEASRIIENVVIGS